MQYIQKEIEFFTNLNPNVLPMEKPGSRFAKYVKKTPVEEWHFQKKYKSRLKLDYIIYFFMHWDHLNR